MKLRGPLAPHERVLQSTRAHGVLALRSVLILLFAVVAWSFSSTLGGAGHWLEWPALALAIWLALVAVRGLLRWWLTVYQLTGERLVVRRGLAVARDIIIPLTEIEGVSVGRKYLVGVAHAADLVVHAHGHQVRLQAVPLPEKFSFEMRTAQAEKFSG
ncbi:PH domain-containing protein [Rothia nasimurium]|uniref:PH domain-containing protein n=1 Tax=Rothia nasimurium TaxID=85336 RepID=UPI003BA0B152